MKLILTLFACLTFAMSMAQGPAQFNYQGVARDAGGHVVTGTIQLRISLLQDAENGPVQYVETHTISTNTQGVFAVHIGNGNIVSGDMDDLDWGLYQYYLKTEMKTGSDVDYITMGASKLLSVPYAMYARESGSPWQAGTGIDLDNHIIHNTGDLSDQNELQTLTLNGNQLAISNGNTVTLPAGTAYNEGQGIEIFNGTITNTGDLSNNNELQSLSIQGQQLQISNGNTVTLPSAPVYTEGPGIDIQNFVVKADDTSPTNEIQTLSLNGQTLSLSQNGGTVNLPMSTDDWDTNGEVLYCSPTRRLTIGETSNGNSKLLVSAHGNENGGTFACENGDAGYFHSNNGHALLVASGNVGIGNTDPTHKFQVNGTSHFSNTSGHALIVGDGPVGIGTTGYGYSKMTVESNAEYSLLGVNHSGKAIAGYSNNVGVAGYFVSQHAPAGWFASSNSLCVFAQQGAVGTMSGQQGIQLQHDVHNWKMYIDAAKDYNFAYNNSLKAWIWDTDGSYHNTSDRNVKKNIRAFSNVLPRLSKLQAYTYQYRDAADDSPLSLGFIAQEVEEHFPDLVVEKEGLKTICYDHFAVLAVEAIKEQQATIEDLTARLVAMEKIISTLTPAEKK